MSTVNGVDLLRSIDCFSWLIITRDLQVLLVIHGFFFFFYKLIQKLRRKKFNAKISWVMNSHHSRSQLPKVDRMMNSAWSLTELYKFMNHWRLLALCRVSIPIKQAPIARNWSYCNIETKNRLSFQVFQTRSPQLLISKRLERLDVHHSMNETLLQFMSTITIFLYRV